MSKDIFKKVIDITGIELTPAGISLAESEFHAQSAFHKSRKGFISLRSVLKGTAHILRLFC